MKKYELVEQEDSDFFQIRALRDFAKVKKGDLGGFVESEDNLSHDGDCWVFDNVKIFDNARIFGNAKISGNTLISGNADVFGNAKVSGNTLISGYASVTEVCSKTPVCIYGLFYDVTITDNHIKIGCECHSIDEWSDFTDEEILAMDNEEALDFWKGYKDFILDAAALHRKSLVV